VGSARLLRSVEESTAYQVSAPWPPAGKEISIAKNDGLQAHVIKGILTTAHQCDIADEVLGTFEARRRMAFMPGQVRKASRYVSHPRGHVLREEDTRYRSATCLAGIGSDLV